MTRMGFVAAAGAIVVGLTCPALAQQTPAPAAQPPAVGFGSTPPGQQTPAPAAPTPQAFDVYRHGPQGFSVVLVLGDMQGTSASDSVPAAARKALADMKDFLPYKGYRLLDVQWTLCCGHNPVMSRLRGADEQDYELELTPSVMPKYSGVPGDSNPAVVVSVRFVLREPAATIAETTDSRAAMENQLQDLRRKQADLERKLGPSHPEVTANAARIRALNQQLADSHSMARRPGSSRAVIDASFRMDVGETVVVGTSRVKGGEKALIALLTAVPQKTTSTK